METRQKALRVIIHIRGLEGFLIAGSSAPELHHMGATIADAILQAGTTYATVVEPRVSEIKNSYPQASTSSGFLHLLETEGAKRILRWKDDEKPNRVMALTRFLVQEGIETEADLAIWLTEEANTGRLQQLRGVGPKTEDYLKILVGIQTAAPDRHVFRFLEEAGVAARDYDEARDILNEAADAMEVERSVLDQSVWRYMSTIAPRVRSSK